MSLSGLLLIEIWERVEQIRSPQYLYFSAGGQSPKLELGALINMGLFTASFFVLIALLVVRREKTQGGPPHFLPTALGGFVLLYFLIFLTGRFLRPALDAIAPAWMQGKFLGWTLGFLCLCLLPGTALIGALDYPRRAWAFIQTTALILFPFAAFCVLKTCWQVAVRPPAIAQKAKFSGRIPLTGKKPLVLWVIFDEMDYAATIGGFEDAPHLPNLDSLRQVSFRAEHAYEPSDFTARSIPSYTTGRIVTNVRWDTAEDLMLRFDGSASFVPWTRQRTIFHEALEAGRNTAILGYFHPYCRLFGQIACACEVFEHPGGGGLVEWRSTLLTQPLYKVAYLQASRVLPSPSTVRRFDGVAFEPWQLAVLRHVERADERCLSRMRRALLGVLGNPGLDFVYIHLPLPHPPALSRIPGTDLRIARRGYSGNLLAADYLLGEIRQALVSAGRWDDSALFITSDHSVRDFWKDSLFLTPSLLRAIESRRERTVPFLVKLPRQKRATVYHEPFNAVVAHDVVIALLREELNRPEQIADLIASSSVKRLDPKRVAH